MTNPDVIYQHYIEVSRQGNFHELLALNGYVESERQKEARIKAYHDTEDLDRYYSY